ncbi:MAG: NAD-dependent deacetylase [Planctomycetota bacterium]
MNRTVSIEQQIEAAARIVRDATHLVIFTGAGISTDSGLPDFRGPDGVWTRRDKGLPPPSRRPDAEIRPNAAHMALVALQSAGRLAYLISQNVDNLHLESGIAADRLAELHGNKNLMRCLACDRQFERDAVGWSRKEWGNGYRTDAVRSGQPPCPACDGRLISSIVNFGDPLPERELRESFRHSQHADAFIVLGSSLQVSPANALPEAALEHGARLVIINMGDTPMDDEAHVRIRAGLGETWPAIVDRALG